MSEELEYGVRCKNPDCHHGFVLGKYMANPKHAGDTVTFVSMKPQRAKCPSCGRTYEYTRDDLEQVPK
jgi:hypothetical protein